MRRGLKMRCTLFFVLLSYFIILFRDIKYLRSYFRKTIFLLSYEIKLRCVINKLQQCLH